MELACEGNGFGEAETMRGAATLPAAISVWVASQTVMAPGAAPVTTASIRMTVPAPCQLSIRARVCTIATNPEFGHFGFGFGAIHGEFTAPAPGGGYETLATQIGTVSSVSSSSITVKSADGFTRSYTVDGNTLVTAGNNGIADVNSGDTVHVLAVVSGGKASAVELVDFTRAQQVRGRWLPPFPSESANG